MIPRSFRNLSCCLLLLLALPSDLVLGQNNAKQYVFRLDDVQDFFLGDSQREIMQWAMQTRTKMSVGVIGSVFGTDDLLVRTIAQCVDRGFCEVFNHGWDAKTRFGETDDLALMERMIGDCDQVIRDSIGYAPKTLVPHQNSWSNFLLVAMRNLDYDIISTSFDEGMEFNMQTWPVRMPQITQTAKFRGVDATPYSNWERYEPIEVLADCERAYANGDEACVIMMHPQEFAEFEVSITDLSRIKELLESNGWVSRTFQEVAQPYIPTNPPRVTPAPTAGPPTDGGPPLQQFQQCGTTTNDPTVDYGINCQDSYCFYSGPFWSSCMPCTTPPNFASSEQFLIKCPTRPLPDDPLASAPTLGPVAGGATLAPTSTPYPTFIASSIPSDAPSMVPSNAPSPYTDGWSEWVNDDFCCSDPGWTWTRVCEDATRGFGCPGDEQEMRPCTDRDRCRASTFSKNGSGAMPTVAVQWWSLTTAAAGAVLVMTLLLPL